MEELLKSEDQAPGRHAVKSKIRPMVVEIRFGKTRAWREELVRV